jgi:hypothetical protein
MIPICEAKDTVVVVVNNYITIVNKTSRRTAGMYNTGNYLRDLHRYNHSKKLQKSKARYFLRYKQNNTKNYTPANKRKIKYTYTRGRRAMLKR